MLAVARPAARTRVRPLAALLLAFACPVVAVAAVTDEVAREARRHLLDEAATAGLVDTAVALKVVGDGATCAAPLDIEPVDTRFLTRMKFAAICSAAPGWRKEFIVRGELSARVVVATARIAAGRPVGPGDVALEKRTLASIEGATSALDAVVGQASRRALRAGQVIDRHWLAQPVLVQRGANVAIVATNGPVRVTTTGEALATGREGDVIDVRNATTGRVIRARVTALDTVEPADLPVAPIPQSAR